GFQNFIHIKRPFVPMKPGETNMVHMKTLGIEFIRPKFIADYSVTMRTNEFTGGSCFIWDIGEWKALLDELKSRKDLFLYSRISNQVNWFVDTTIPPENSIVLDKRLWLSLVVRQTKGNPEPFYAPKYRNEANKQYR